MYIKDNFGWDNWYYDTHYTTYSYWSPVPTTKDFTLDVISHHPDFEGKTLKKYNLDGIDTIGAYGDERFTVRFSNNSNEDVQVRLSLDGTDCYTGKLANLEINHDMFVVRAHKTLSLKAWRETNNGGAAFVFTSGDKSVALHTHGDVSHKGIIAAAVYVEKDRVSTRTTSIRRPMMPKTLPHYTHTSNNIGSTLGGVSYSSNAVAPEPAAYNMFDSLNIDYERSEGAPSPASVVAKTASVGAGEYVEQKLTTVQGLNNPVLNSVVRVRYCWYDNLVAKLKTQQPRDSFPTGFPGEKAKTFADLSGVPRVQSAGSQPQTINMFEQPSIPMDKIQFARTV